MKLSTLTDFMKIKNKIRNFWSILKKYKKEISFFLFFLISEILLIISPSSTLKKLAAISQSDVSIIKFLFYAILIAIVLTLCILVFIFIDKKFRSFIKRNSSLVSIFLVLLTIIVTFSSFYVDKTNKFVKINNALMMANQLNYKYAKDFVEDKNQEWTYWTYFNSNLYKENLDFILSNFPEKCSSDYVGILYDIEIVNELNHLINTNSAWGIVFSDTKDLIEHDILFKKHKKELLFRSSHIKYSLKNLFKECYNLDIE